MSTTPLITPEALVSRYGFTISPTQIDKYVGLIEASTVACSHYLQRDLGVSSFSEYFDGPSQVRVLAHAPVHEISAVYLDAGRRYLDPLDPSEYRLDPESGILVIYKAIPAGVDAVKVVYQAGWSDVPADVLYCIAMTVQHMATIQASNMAGVSSRTTDGGTETLDQSLPPLAIQSHLAKYRRIPVR